jgi:2-methylcitrate dehydratase
MGLPSVLTAKHWGFQDVLFEGKPIELERPLGCYVMENVLFKISFPAEFHAQTAVEAAVMLHPRISGCLDQIREIKVWTHESAMRIICKTGQLNNPADRDHCLQYMIAIALLYGDLDAEHYENAFHTSDSRIDLLRSLMVIEEQPEYTRDYLDPGKRSIANALQIVFKDGSATDLVAVEYPIGHRRRRTDGIPLLEKKFLTNLATRFPLAQVRKFSQISLDQSRLEGMRVDEWMKMLVIN